MYIVLLKEQTKILDDAALNPNLETTLTLEAKQGPEELVNRDGPASIRRSCKVLAFPHNPLLSFLATIQ